MSEYGLSPGVLSELADLVKLAAEGYARARPATSTPTPDTSLARILAIVRTALEPAERLYWANELMRDLQAANAQFPLFDRELGDALHDHNLIEARKVWHAWASAAQVPTARVRSRGLDRPTWYFELPSGIRTSLEALCATCAQFEYAVNGSPAPIPVPRLLAYIPRFRAENDALQQQISTFVVAGLDDLRRLESALSMLDRVRSGGNG